MGLNKEYLRVTCRINFFGRDQGSTLNDPLPDWMKSLKSPLEIDGKYFDCGVMLGPERHLLGRELVLAIEFLDDEAVRPHLQVGKRFHLFGYPNFADGEILKIDTAIRD